MFYKDLKEKGLTLLYQSYLTKLVSRSVYNTNHFTDSSTFSGKSNESSAFMLDELSISSSVLIAVRFLPYIIDFQMFLPYFCHLMSVSNSIVIVPLLGLTPTFSSKYMIEQIVRVIYRTV